MPIELKVKIKERADTIDALVEGSGSGTQLETLFAVQVCSAINDKMVAVAHKTGAHSTFTKEFPFGSEEAAQWRKRIEG